MPAKKPAPKKAAPTHFESQGDFRAWLDKHHAREEELLVGFHKAASGKGGLTYKQALDEALCFGWIDGLRRTISPDVWTIRFTPRKRGSIWSAVNARRVEELKALGRMTPGGLAAYAAREAKNMKRYSFEQDAVAFSPAERKALHANAAARAFFTAQAPGYQKVATWWVVSAKKPETRARRLEELVARSAEGHRLRHLVPPAKRTY